ncbi:MAG: winged helix-turn-helix transcriptional regulator [Candidatus Thorarchaeota archaeon]|nr:MAG: winged helix-turn-helix transcriptional regulator [Candidatus Thorarchaeota archaeon]
MTLKASLDPLDLKIIRALEEHGAKISTRELSELLNEPGRTIRYRITKLKEKGIICKAKVRTHERKLGLAEYVFVVSSSTVNESTLKKIIEEIPMFYYHAQTYGKYEGYLIYLVYPLGSPHVVQDIASELKKRGLIEDYTLFDVVDYESKEANLSQLETWNWDKWSKNLPKIMAKSKELKLDLEESQEPVSFDSNDTLILGHMVENPDITLRELGKILGLSQPQVHSRVKRLEESRIIRGYKLSMKPYDSTMTIACFFKSKNAGKILLWFDQLPFHHQITMENKTSYLVQISLPSHDMNELLKNLRILRQYTDEMFVQFLLDASIKGYRHLMDLFYEGTESWRLPYDEFNDVVDRLTKEEN